jgi:peptidyl-prolyl cis-trans isomerase SurA
MIALRLSRLCFALALLLTTGLSTELRAQSVVVMVNGEPITSYDIDQRSKLTQLSTRKTPPRQEVIEELINEKVKIKEGKKFGIDPSGADIDSSFANMGSRMRMSPEQLTQTLANSGIRPDTLKHRMRAEMVWTSLVRGRFKDSLLVGEKDIQAALGDSDKPAGESFEYQMRPVVLIVPRNAAPASREARMKEAEALRARVQTCEEANALFKSMPNAAIRATVSKTSADLPPSLRELLDKTPIGHLTAPEATKQGVEMVALCSRKPTTADTPKKREIREKMFAEKFEAKSKAYLRDVRKAAMVEYR